MLRAQRANVIMLQLSSQYPFWLIFSIFNLFYYLLVVKPCSAPNWSSRQKDIPRLWQSWCLVLLLILPISTIFFPLAFRAAITNYPIVLQLLPYGLQPKLELTYCGYHIELSQWKRVSLFRRASSVSLVIRDAGGEVSSWRYRSQVCR